MKPSTIKLGKVVLPKIDKLTVDEFYFITDYIQKILDKFNKPTKLVESYKDKMTRLIKKSKAKQNKTK